MGSYKNFSQKKRAIADGAYSDLSSALSHDPIKKKDIEYGEWVKFISYYRYYIDKFAVDILGVKLYPFQRLILRAMGRYDNSMQICCRGIGKSWLSALFMICVAILYPGAKIGICSGKGQQARNVIIQKIKGELSKNINVAREIKGQIKTSADDCVVEFKNGSEIRAIVLGQNKAGDSARSWRFNILLIDEARLVPDKTIEDVLVPMTKTKRQNVIDWKFDHPEEDIKESGKMIFISSAYLKTCDLYKRFLFFYNQMVTGSDKYFAVSLDYRVGVDAGMFDEEDIMSEKDKPTMTPESFKYEYEGIFVGSANDSYYPFDMTVQCRVLDRCELSQPHNSIYSYIVTHDVAVSGNNNSDNACTHVIKLIPKKDGTFDKQVVFSQTMNGIKLKEQRDFLRELVHVRFPNTEKLVVDAASAGEGLLSLLEEPWSYKNDKGKIIEKPPLIKDDDEETQRLLPEAVPMVRAIVATNEFNTSFYPYMKSCVEDKSLQLLVDSHEVDEDYKNDKYSPQEYYIHVEHDMLISEMSNIRQSFTNFGNLIYERIVKKNKRDRATSLMYGLSVVFEREKQGKADVNKKAVNELDYLRDYIF